MKNLFYQINQRWLKSRIHLYTSARFQPKHITSLETKINDMRNKRQHYHYINNPKLSIIVQFFNKRQNIKSIIKSLRLTTAEEIIVIDDGSIDGSYEDWIEHLDRPNDFLLRCNDLFEVRTYDRAISMARGEFVCLLQDDDLPPDNNQWIEDALTLFKTYPDLIMLGGRNGIDTMMPKPNDSQAEQEYRQMGNIIECAGLHKLRIYSEPCYREPASNIPFMFTMSVNRAPTFLRKTEFLKIGGINQKYAPFQFDDDEAGIRAWLSGYQVGFYACPFLRGVDVGGMSLFNKEKIKSQSLKNIKMLYDEYSKLIENHYIQNMVNTANSFLIKKD